MATRDKVEKALAAMALVFPEKNLSKQGVEIYCQMLSSLTDDELNRAAIKCLADCRFFPTIAEILDAAREEQGSPMEAFWNIACSRSVKLDQITNDAIAAVGGHQILRETTISKLPGLAHIFRAEYAAARKKANHAKMLTASVDKLFLDGRSNG